MKVGLAAVVALFAVSIVSLSVANVLLKIAMVPAAESTYAAGFRTAALVGGMVLMIAQFAGMLLLEHWGLDVSVVVPVFGLNFALTALLGALWLGEPVGGLRWAGIAAVTVGVYLIARSSVQ